MSEWLAFVQIEGPFGVDRGDIQAAVAGLPTANAFRKPGSRPFKLADMVPRFVEAPSAQRRKDWEEQKAYMIGLTLARRGHVDPKHLPEGRNG